VECRGRDGADRWVRLVGRGGRSHRSRARCLSLRSLSKRTLLHRVRAPPGVRICRPAALPEPDRRRAAILASNYGEAAAIDVFGAKDHLPPALSEQNQYFLWGTRGYDGSVVIAVNANPRRWARICDRIGPVASFGVACDISPAGFTGPVEDRRLNEP
jgi:hypothetical protein